MPKKTTKNQVKSVSKTVKYKLSNNQILELPVQDFEILISSENPHITNQLLLF